MPYTIRYMPQPGLVIVERGRFTWTITGNDVDLRDANRQDLGVLETCVYETHRQAIVETRKLAYR